MDKPVNKPDRRPLGVVESLSSGFDLILQNPWILLIPIALDLFLWLGPQISIKPLLQSFMGVVSLAAPPNTPADQMQATQQVLRTLADSMNLFGILATGMPTVIGINPPVVGTPRPFIVVSDTITTVGLGLLFGLLGALILSGYLELAACSIRQELSLRTLLKRWLSSFLHLVSLMFLVMFGLFMLMIPVALVSVVLGKASQAVAGFLMLGGVMLAFWALLYLVFAVPAIFVSRANAAQALLDSVSVFRFDFWSAIGLIFVVYLVKTGFVFVWQFFDGNVAGVVFNVIANAFLSSGLIAGLMIFYHDRMYWLTVIREHIRKQQSEAKS
jgi:hypothetical protein